MSGSIFDPNCPPLVRTAALFSMACFAFRVGFDQQLQALLLPRPGSIITLSRPILDEKGDELQAGLDVVVLDCDDACRILASADREDETAVAAWIRPGEWYQREGKR